MQTRDQSTNFLRTLLFIFVVLFVFLDIFIIIRNINTSYFDVSVTGPGGYNSTVLHGEGYNAGQDSGLWEEHLRTGTYQVVLTSHQSPGTASVYLKTP